MTFRQFTKFSLSLSAILIVVSAAVFIYPGPKFSIEFTGGTLMEIQTGAEKTRDDVLATLKKYEQVSKKNLGNVAVSSTKISTGKGFLLRLPTMENADHLALLAEMQKCLGSMKELSYNTIGPSVSASLRTKSLEAIFIASIAVITYLTFSFRKLPKRLIKPWRVGVIAVVAFLHDITVTAGVFTVISWYSNFEFDTLFVTALLTILAYSTNEAIIVFDRIRENISQQKRDEDVSTTVATALKQCVGRTGGTTVAILIMLFSLYFLGSESIRWFVLALIFGTCIGVYSSYLVAAPLLAFWGTKRN